MRIAAYHSHLNGLEFLLVHKPALWDEIQSVLASVDAEKHKTKLSREKTKIGQLLYAPKEMNASIKAGFKAFGWSERRVTRYVSDDSRLTREILLLDAGEQKRRIEAKGKVGFKSYNQTDFYKDRVMIEVQFGKYAFIAHDLFVKHMAFFTTDAMDVGIEVLPTKALQAQMSSGVPYYEGALYDLIRQGRGVPHVPLVLVGVEPDVAVDADALAAEAAEEEAAIDAGRAASDDPSDEDIPGD